MSLDLTRVRAEASAVLTSPPYGRALAVAVLNDRLRLAGQQPIPSSGWQRLLAGKHPADDAGEDHREEQIVRLAQLCAETSLGAETVARLAALGKKEPERRLARFLAEVWPITGAMIVDNAFRQEELLRRWLAALDGEVAGESAAESARRLDQLDYRKALSEYERADKARKAEAKKRERAIREAQERAAAAQGWHE